MSQQAWTAVLVVVLVFVALAVATHPPYLVLLAALSALVLLGVLDVEQAFAGFGNPGLVTVAVLFVVAGCVRQTGVLAHLVSMVLGQPRTALGAQLRLLPAVALASAFVNNTPVVAVLVPVVIDWCKRTGIAPSRLLLPLSYAAILGGLCTLIGTSTNLVVDGMLVARGLPGFATFDMAWVGVPCALVGLLLVLTLGARLLPADDGAARRGLQQPSEYTVEMVVTPGSRLVGRSIEAAGLRRLPGLYLMEIHRGDQLLGMVEPGEHLAGGDQLVFVGAVDAVVDLQRLPGLQAASKQLFRLAADRVERCFVEAVVSRSNPLVGQSIREGRFRNRYDAVVLAVSRDGGRVPGRLGDIVLQPGDALLVEAHPAFIDRQRGSRDFLLVSRFEGEGPPATHRAGRSVVILVAMVVLAGSGLLPMLHAALLAAGALLLARCGSEETVLRSIDWPMLLAIGASFGLGEALSSTGAAAAIADALLRQAGDNPYVALALVYGVTTLLSEFVTNNAAAILVVPIALSTAEGLGVSHLPFAIAVMVAASASFATPLGYQTNLMVYGPGGYRIVDFLRMGVPMNLLLWAMTSLLTPIVWPF